MEKTNEILTIEGERVKKRYSAKAGDCCHKCRFWSDAYGMCRAERADSTPPCKDYDSKECGFAYFVPAEEKRRKIRVKNMAEIKAELQKNIDDAEDADKAAEEACAKCPISGRCFVEDKGRKDACDYLRGVKAGIAYERGRLMKEGDDELEKMIDDFEDWVGSYSRADLPTSYTTRDIARFFANWERERLMKEAVEVAEYYDFENRLAVTAQLPEDSPHKFCDKVKLIILK